MYKTRTCIHITLHCNLVIAVYCNAGPDVARGCIMPPLDECRRLHAAGMTWSHIMPCITACAAMYADDADAAFVQRHMQLLAQLCSWQVQKATQPMQPHPNSSNYEQRQKHYKAAHTACIPAHRLSSLMHQCKMLILSGSATANLPVDVLWMLLYLATALMLASGKREPCQWQL